VAKKKSKENDYIDCCSNDKLFTCNVPSSLIICNVFLEPTSHAKRVGDRNPTAACTILILCLMCDVGSKLQQLRLNPHARRSNSRRPSSFPPPAPLDRASSSRPGPEGEKISPVLNKPRTIWQKCKVFTTTCSTWCVEIVFWSWRRIAQIPIHLAWSK
jgi:hypothetical protein